MQDNNQKYINAENLKHEHLAPIVLFVYNRPWHTQQTVEALQQNIYAKESELIIYSDAPKDDKATQKVQEVRDYIQSITGFKNITIIQQTTNQGLANSIINGVTEIVNKYGKIIVLEDDIVTSKYFLKYMNDALEIYKDEDKVMEVAGFLYPIDISGIKYPFFSSIGECWGWATWSRAWKHFERNPDKLIQEFSQDDIYNFNFEGTYDYCQQVLDNQSGKLYTWSIFFAAIIFKLNGLVLYPPESMSKNVGLDNSGVHCGVSTDFVVKQICAKPITKYPTTITESKTGYEAIKKFFIKIKPTIMRRIKSKIKRILSI